MNDLDLIGKLSFTFEDKQILHDLYHLLYEDLIKELSGCPVCPVPEPCPEPEPCPCLSCPIKFDNGNLILSFNTGIKYTTDSEQCTLVSALRTLRVGCKLQFILGSTQSPVTIESTYPLQVRYPDQQPKAIATIEDTYTKAGYTNQRPKDVPVGYNFFDMTLSLPIWKSWDGWIDANGNPV